MRAALITEVGPPKVIQVGDDAPAVRRRPGGLRR